MENLNGNGTEQPPVVLTPAPPKPGRVRWAVVIPGLLFLATIVSTFLARSVFVRPFNYEWGIEVGRNFDTLFQAGWVGYLFRPRAGLIYCFGVMTILTAHELGHFFTARRYGVRTSLPFFLPLPLISPTGTLGAVIAMPPGMPNRKVLFDVGIGGPIAGLIPTMIFLVIGLQWSTIVPEVPGPMKYGEPLIIKWIAQWVLGPTPEGSEILIHPIGFSAWVGVLLTALNLIPIGQLDGGHILYGILRHKAHPVATALLWGTVAATLYFKLYHWWLLLLLIFFMGPKHPPTVADEEGIGTGRIVLGILCLGFVPIGITPTPIVM